MSAPTDAPVVVRNNLWFRLASPVFALVAVAAWSSLWAVTIRGTGGATATVRIVVGLLMLVLVLVLVLVLHLHSRRADGSPAADDLRG